MPDEPDTSEPNDGGDDSKLELPTLSLRRRRKQKQQATAPDEEPTAAATAPEPAPEPVSEPVAEPAPEPVAETPVEAEVPPPPPEPEPAPETAAEEAHADPEPEHDDMQVLPSAPEQAPEPVAETPVEAEVPPPAPALVAEEAQAEPAPEHDDTQVLPSAPETLQDPHDGYDEPLEQPAAPATRPTKVTKQRKELTLPTVAAPVAAALTGLIIGLGIVALTFVSKRGCQAVKGTENCGGIGLVFLVAILVLAVLVGGVLLRAWKIGDPLNTSFLAVGLVAVIAMLFFLDHIDAWWMVIVIPVIAALTYLLSWWVTRTFVDTAGDHEAHEEVDLDKVGL